jgi:hypothetical protein
MRKPKIVNSYPSPKRRRWTVSEARTVLAAQEASRLTPAEFATREGLDVQKIHRWRRRLSSAKTAALAVPGFAEVTPAVGATRAEARFEVELASGHVVRVPAGFDGADLRRLIAALEATC